MSKYDPSDGLVEFDPCPPGTPPYDPKTGEYKRVTKAELRNGFKKLMQAKGWTLEQLAKEISQPIERVLDILV